LLRDRQRRLLLHAGVEHAIEQMAALEGEDRLARRSQIERHAKAGLGVDPQRLGPTTVSR